MEKKIKVLMIGPHHSVQGGIQTVVSNYLHSTDWSCVEITYIPTFIEKNSLRKITFFIWNLQKIWKLCKTEHFDVAHLHMAERGSFVRKALVHKLCYSNGIPTIIHHHGAEFIEFYESSPPWMKNWIVKTIDHAAMNLVLGEYHAKIMRKHFQNANIQVLYNAVDTKVESQYRPDATGILFVGRLGQRKGIYDLLNAFAACKDQLSPETKLYLCGDGEVAQVAAKAAELGLQNRIAHLGWCCKEQLADIYRDTMLYILPSYHEGLPMALLEAMSAGIPCIASTAGAISEVIVDGENGLLINAGDIGGIMQSIEALAKCKKMRLQLSSHAFSTIRSRFNIQKHIKQLEMIYKAIQERTTSNQLNAH